MSDYRFGPEYPKINTVFKRDMEAGGVIITDQLAEEEFKYLLDNEWVWTEKVDGTNIRLHFDGESIAVGGRTDSAQIPGGLMFALGPFNNPSLWRSVFAEGGGPTDVTIYGEGYGPKIQNGGRYTVDPAFIVFDIRIGRWWLKREDVIDVAAKLGMRTVPIVLIESLKEAIRRVLFAANTHVGLRSVVSGVEEFTMEGLVGTPSVPLFARNGSRVIAKLKVKDFEDLYKHETRRAVKEERV